MGEGGTTPKARAIYDADRPVDVSSNSWGWDECRSMGANLDERRRSSDDACPFVSDDAWSAQSAADLCATSCAGQDWTSSAVSHACHEAIADHCEWYFESDEDAPSARARAGRRRGRRGGKGVIYVWATGNGYEHAGYYQQLEYMNNRFAITVGAVGRDLRKSSYSEGGPATFVVAPASDHDDVHGMIAAIPVVVGATGDCGDIGVGTSFACPLVAGVAALVLEANPQLGWRDVQGILASTSQRVDLASDDSWTTNLAGVSHSYKYGFGLVDALAAVRAAQTWTNWPEEQKLEAAKHEGAVILDFDGAEHWVESEIEVPEAEFLIESVVVYVTIKHPHRGELWIELERNGVTSILTDDMYDASTRYSDWKYLTLRHWGEAADLGPFTLRVADKRRGTTDGSSFPEWAYPGFVYGDDDGDQNGELPETEPASSPPTPNPSADPTAKPTPASTTTTPASTTTTPAPTTTTPALSTTTTPAPAAPPGVAGELDIGGMTLADAVDNSDVFAATIAAIAGADVDAGDVEVTIETIDGVIVVVFFVNAASASNADEIDEILARDLTPEAVAEEVVAQAEALDVADAFADVVVIGGGGDTAAVVGATTTTAGFAASGGDTGKKDPCKKKKLEKKKKCLKFVKKGQTLCQWDETNKCHSKTCGSNAEKKPCKKAGGCEWKKGQCVASSGVSCKKQKKEKKCTKAGCAWNAKKEKCADCAKQKKAKKCKKADCKWKKSEGKCLAKK
ncbi:serine-type endopeptidase [Aureococcus anophagefferens]|nr:serine-type endopeptidase [Aureococcus anophagefferens]